MLRDEDKKQIGEILKEMTGPVTFHYFTQTLAGACQYCTETEQLLKELAELSENLTLETHNFVNDKELVEEYGIDKIPAIVIQGKNDTGIRFYGIPTGYEFAAFLQCILMLSGAEIQIPQDVQNRLEGVTDPVHIQVFVTPTCPHCTRAALAAYQFAMLNENVRADIVEVSEFPHLAQKYSVSGVPKVVINETTSFEGALPEPMFMDNIEKAVQS